MHSQPISIPPTKHPTYIQAIHTAPPPLYLRGHKVPRVPSGISQSFQLDLLKQSVNPNIQSPDELKFLTSTH